jgi:hypothetical protein
MHNNVNKKSLEVESIDINGPSTPSAAGSPNTKDFIVIEQLRVTCRQGRRIKKLKRKLR